jgi:hypothetical protein
MTLDDSDQSFFHAANLDYQIVFFARVFQGGRFSKGKCYFISYSFYNSSIFSGLRHWITNSVFDGTVFEMTKNENVVLWLINPSVAKMRKGKTYWPYHGWPKKYHLE